MPVVFLLAAEGWRRLREGPSLTRPPPCRGGALATVVAAVVVQSLVETLRHPILTLDPQLFLDPPEWELGMLGRGVQRRFRIGDVAFDRTNGILYVLELYADGAKPVVHVFRVS